MKRILTVLIFALALTGILGLTSFSDFETVYEVQVQYPERFEAYDAPQVCDAEFDTEALKEYLKDALMRCEEEIDISSFNIEKTQENIDLINNLVFNEMPECFHVDYHYLRFYPSQITNVIPVYNIDTAEYQDMFAEILAVKDKLLKDIKGNDALGEVEKALLIHDRLALLCEYDYTYSTHRSDLYGALVNRTAVCQGYSVAYEYLLEEVGIDSYICSSDLLNHAWNIVYINGIPYHVDVTWDDYAWYNGQRGAVGAIIHDSFLRSTEGIFSTGHYAYDYDNTPCDTTYDDYFWQDASSAFQLAGGEIYYIDNVNEQLKRYKDGKVILDVSDVWWAGMLNFWPGNYARLSSDGERLYYSLSNAVYEFDPVTQNTEKVFAPDLNLFDAIYGFDYIDGYFVCDINNSPPYAGDLRGLYQIKEAYEYIPSVVAVGIEINSLPSKTVYHPGDALNTDGLSLNFVFSDGSVKPVTEGFTVSGFDSTAVGTKTVTVSYEGFTDVFEVAFEHGFVCISEAAPSCDASGNIAYLLCSVCNERQSADGTPLGENDVVIPALGHVWGEWNEIKAPTCAEQGEKSRNCTVCGVSESGTVPVSEHSYGTAVTEPTCTEDGFTAYICVNCGYGYTADSVPALGHDIVDGGCRRCGHTEKEFKDIKPGKWYTDAVYFCFGKGYMAGVSDDTFGYKETVTRAMFATILAKIDGAELSAYGEMSFDDVKRGKWYSNSIEWAYQNGYAAGLGEGIFGYKNEVTREQIAMFFYTYSEKTGMDVSGRADIESFADYDRIHVYALDAMAWAVDAELIAGTGENCVSPRASATRSEIALIVANYVKTVKPAE
ncbi:MAG: S-layer homology domain-containing protein [Clostridia bacterium]|nr:S-layer homology domain-containing protein [Clostridia bacterium]